MGNKHKLSDKLERIQKTCLRVILGEMYIGYSAALKMSGLDTLFSRRCIDFSLKCMKNKRLAKAFPLKPAHGQNTRESEMFTVNFESISTYRDSAIPLSKNVTTRHEKNCKFSYTKSQSVLILWLNQAYLILSSKLVRYTWTLRKQGDYTLH